MLKNEACALETQRPHSEYKKEFLSRILALAPESVLDVGCGEGALMQALAQAGVNRCVGIETDEAAAIAARQKGLDVYSGRAEALPFGDRGFDVVTFEYVTHHLEHMARGLSEAIRIARRAVLILDVWYDESLPSQRTARLLDDWYKTIDRRRAMVHHPCPSAVDLAAPFLASGAFSIDYAYRLRLVPMSIASAEAKARKHLEAVASCAGLGTDLERILDLARLHGLTDDGAVVLVANRTND